MTTIVTLVSDLPVVIQGALHLYGYRRKDIHVHVQDAVSLANSGGAGCRAFTVVLNLATGQSEALVGSWGGSNAFNPTNRVDLDTQSRPLGENVVVIKGSEGGNRPVYCTLYIGSKNVLPLLPAAPELSPRERGIVWIFDGHTSAARKDELSRHKVTTAEIDALCEKGLIVRKGNGIQVTVAGKNARQGLNRWPSEAA